MLRKMKEFTPGSEDVKFEPLGEVDCVAYMDYMCGEGQDPLLDGATKRGAHFPSIVAFKTVVNNVHKNHNHLFLPKILFDQYGFSNLVYFIPLCK